MGGMSCGVSCRYVVCGRCVVWEVCRVGGMSCGRYVVWEFWGGSGRRGGGVNTGRARLCLMAAPQRQLMRQLMRQLITHPVIESGVGVLSFIAKVRLPWVSVRSYLCSSQQIAQSLLGKGSTSLRVSLHRSAFTLSSGRKVLPETPYGSA